MQIVLLFAVDVQNWFNAAPRPAARALPHESVSAESTIAASIVRLLVE